MLARNREAAPVAIAHRVRHPAFWPGEAVPGLREWSFRSVLHGGEYLPVTFEPELVVGQPCVYHLLQPEQLALVGPEDGQVVHVADVVRGIAALPDEVVERLEGHIGEPLRRVRTNLNPIFDDAPDEVEDTAVTDEPLHAGHDHLGLQALIKMVDVSAQLILGAALVILHPPLDGLAPVVRAPAPDAPAAVVIHTAHEGRLEHLDECVVNVLVRPLCRLADDAPFSGAGVPAA